MGDRITVMGGVRYGGETVDERGRESQPSCESSDSVEWWRVIVELMDGRNRSFLGPVPSKGSGSMYCYHHSFSKGPFQ